MNLRAKLNNFKLRTKFVLPISVLLVASILVVSGYLIERQADGYRREMETNGETMVRIIAMQAESGVLFESKYELDELLNKFAAFDVVEAAIIYSQQGQVLTQLGSWSPEAARVIRPIVHAQYLTHSVCRDHYVADDQGREYIEMNYPVQSKVEQLDRENLGITSGIDRTLGSNYVTEEIGSVKLIVKLDKVNQAIREAQTAAIVLMIGVALLTIAILTSFVRFITRPIQLLVDVTDQVARGDLSQHVDIEQHDEIGQLATTFNKMIESLKLSRDEIEMYNRTLEEKIIQGTLQLEEAQAQLVQSEKMSAIGQLAAGVAHELNNPLGGILGYAQFTLEKMKKSGVEGQSKEMQTYVRYLTDIEAQARRCKAIVQNLLRFSRSSRTTEFEEVDTEQVIRDTATFVEHQLHMNQIDLHIDCDPNIPKLQGNPGQLQQVFTNLIINAMHASPPESVINIEALYSPALGEFGGAVEVSVYDRGHGISPENLNKIFEPFFTTKDVGKGTGLGLSVSYGIIKEHGGEIKVDSVPGDHTVFTIVLPVQGSSGEADTASEDPKRLKTESRSL
ncbi:MAG: ATP-binding protein [bacterium]